MELLGWRAMKSDRLVGSFIFNVMHLSLVQPILYKQHYIKHNAIKLTFAWLAAIFGGETAAFGLSTKIKSILQPRILFNYLSKNIFVLYRYAWKRQPLCLNCCWGLPILKKNAISGSLKKRNFWVPIFGGGKIVPQLTLSVHTISNLPTNRVKWRTAL